MDRTDDIADALVVCFLADGRQPPVSLRTRITTHQGEPGKRVVLGRRDDGTTFVAFLTTQWSEYLTALATSALAADGILEYARSGDLGHFLTVPRAFLVELLETSKRLVLCGHGAGGAAAVLAGSFLALECEDASKGLTPEAVASGEEALKLKEKLSIVTFGGPACAPWGPLLAGRLRDVGIAANTTHLLRDDDPVPGLFFSAGSKLPAAPAYQRPAPPPGPSLPTTAKEAAAAAREAAAAAGAEAARVGDAVKSAAVSKSLGALQSALYSSGTLAGASYPLLVKLFTPGPAPAATACRVFPGNVHVLSEREGAAARFFHLPADEDVLQALSEALSLLPASALHAARAAAEKHSLPAYASAFLAVSSPPGAASSPEAAGEVNMIAAGRIARIAVDAVEISARHTRDQCLVRVAVRGEGLSQVLEAELAPSLPATRALQRVGYTPAAPAGGRCLVLEAPLPAGWRFAVGSEAGPVALRLSGPFASAAVAVTARCLRDSPQLRARVGRLSASAVVECAASVALLELLSDPPPPIPAPVLAPAPVAAPGEEPPPRLSRWAADAVEKLDKGLASLHAEDFATYCTRQLFEYLSAHDRHRQRRAMQAAAARAAEAALAAPEPEAEAGPEAEAEAEGAPEPEGEGEGAGAGEGGAARPAAAAKAKGKKAAAAAAKGKKAAAPAAPAAPAAGRPRRMSLAFLSATLPAGLVPLHPQDLAAARTAFADAAGALEAGALRARVEELPRLFRDAGAPLAFAERERLLAGLSRCSFAALAAALARAPAAPEAPLLADDFVFLSALLNQVLDGSESKWIVGPATGGEGAPKGPKAFFKALLEEVREGAGRASGGPITGPSYTHRLFALAGAHGIPPAFDDSYAESRLINSAHFGDVKLVYLLRQALWSAPAATLVVGAPRAGKSSLLRILLGPAAVPAGPSGGPVRAYVAEGAAGGAPQVAAELCFDRRAAASEAARPRRLAHSLLPAAAAAAELLRRAAGLGCPAVAVLTRCDALYAPEGEERVERFQAAVRQAAERMRVLAGEAVPVLAAVLSEAAADAFVALAPEGIRILDPKALAPALRSACSP
eukprot:tig00001030_g6450.t1